MGKQSVWKLYDSRIIQMRQSGYTLQEIGDYAGVTRERVRQLLLKRCGKFEMPVLTENRVAREIGYPIWQVTKLRKQGILKPKHRGKHMHCYDMSELEGIKLALRRYCPQCGDLIVMKSVRKYCPECREKRRQATTPR